MSLGVNRSQSTIELLRAIRNRDPRDGGLFFPEDRQVSVPWEDARVAKIVALDPGRLDILTPSSCENGEQYLEQVIKEDVLLLDLAAAVALMDQDGQVYLNRLPEYTQANGVRIAGTIIQWSMSLSAKQIMTDHLIVTKVEGYWDFGLFSAERFYEHESLDTLIYHH